MIYTNPNLLRRGNKTQPVILGPVFLYWDGAYSTDCDFLAKIRSNWGYDLPVEKLIFSTDEEKAFILVNAIKTTFSGASNILCARRYKENDIWNLNKHNIPEAAKNKLIISIFSPCGLLSSGSLVRFLKREQEMLESFEDSPAYKYCTEKLFAKIKESSFHLKTAKSKKPPTM